MFEKRLLIVGGKGGVGRSTVSAALGVAAARRGLSTIVAEVAGQSDVAAVLGVEPAERLREVELEHNLHHITIERWAALQEYLREEVPGVLPAAILSRSNLFELFVEATPGMRELLTIGKVWELTQRPRHTRGARPYDLVVLDAPASGQLIALLGAPRTFSSIARVGPVAHQGSEIDRMLKDPGYVGLIAVTTAEQMAVTEVLSLDGLLTDRFNRRLDAVVVNRMVPARFSGGEASALASAADDPAVRSAQWLYGRVRAQQAQLARLRRGLGSVRRTTLPYLFTSQLARADIERMADRLGRSL
jgi:Mrp family chromosome partitioning ATPase